MKSLFWMGLFALGIPFFVQAQSTTSIFVSAHPDDWQLFMNPNAYHAVKDSNKTVIFLHTTAGEAGRGTGYNDYYLAREEGSKRAIRFMSNAFTTGAGLGTDMKAETITVNGHSIQKFTYRNAIAYFLRLPDGNGNGSGFPLHDSISLEKFYTGLKPKMKAVDGSTTYESLKDLKKTIKKLITPNGKNTILEVHLADTNAEINPYDHSDHRFSSHIVQEVVEEFNLNATVHMYKDYSSREDPINIEGDDFLICAGTWGATVSGLSDMGHYSTWDQGHNTWIGRQYFRVK